MSIQTGQGNGTWDMQADPGADWYQIGLEGEDAAITGGSLAITAKLYGMQSPGAPVDGSPLDLATAHAAVISTGSCAGFQLTLSGLTGATTVRCTVKSGSRS